MRDPGHHDRRAARAGVYEEVLRAGGLPILQMTHRGGGRRPLPPGSEEQLAWIPPPSKWAVENADVRIAIMADANTARALPGRPEEAGARPAARKDLMETSMKRSAAGEYRWALTLFPTHAYASQAGMSLSEYEDFYYGACLATDAEPVTAWQRQSDEVNRLSEWMTGKEEVHVQAPGTDIKLGVEGRTWIPCAGSHNMPDGEFFTGPVEDSVEGEVAFSFPATYSGREVAGVRFRFEGGKIVDASAERGEDFLLEMLDTDDGARRLGRARHRHELRDHDRHEGDPARREDRRHGAHGDRHELSGDGRHQQLRRALGHDLRPAPGRHDHRGRAGAAAGRPVPGLMRAGAPPRLSARRWRSRSRRPPPRSTRRGPPPAPSALLPPAAPSHGAGDHRHRAGRLHPHGATTASGRASPRSRATGCGVTALGTNCAFLHDTDLVLHARRRRRRQDGSGCACSRHDRGRGAGGGQHAHAVVVRHRGERPPAAVKPLRLSSRPRCRASSARARRSWPRLGHLAGHRAVRLRQPLGAL